MTLPLPNLDDRTYADLLAEARALIPSEYPAWTDHNPSDSGIIMLELFAWLTEMLLYRVNQIPDRNIVTFLNLLNGSPAALSNAQDLPAAIHDTVLELRRRHRAVTVADFEQLALHDWSDQPEAKILGELGKIQRAHCLPQVNLESTDPIARKLAPGHISLVVLPQYSGDNSTLRAALWNFLDQRRLLTTQHHVVEPEYVPVVLETTLQLVAGASSGQVKQQAIAIVNQFFDPRTGGKDGQGWPFGRNVYPSEVYELLDHIPGVDFVETLKLQKTPPDPENTLEDHQQITLEDHQLVTIQFEAAQLTLRAAWEREN
jgi:hypothetical protein